MLILSTFRAFLIVFKFLAVGRAGEVATINWDKTLWCPIQNIFRLTWSSTKTSKDKGLGIFSEKVFTFIDFYLLLSHLFIMGYFVTNRTAEAEDPLHNFWFQKLRSMSVKSVAPTISRYLQDVAPGSDSKTYSNYVVASVPQDVSRSSLRISGVNIMASKGVSLENIVNMTGHFLTGMSAVFEYLLITVTSTVIGELKAVTLISSYMMI